MCDEFKQGKVQSAIPHTSSCPWHCRETPTNPVLLTHGSDYVNLPIDEHPFHKWYKLGEELLQLVSRA
jgi:hypothetical protein